MKSIVLLLGIVFSLGSIATAQHPLIGTWEMISVKGIDADGNPFFDDTTTVKETKIITPTHYMLIAWDVDKDSLYFNRTMAGQVELKGNQYIEVPTQASVQIFENVEVDFRWKLEGDIFTQSGTIVRPDGKKVILEALKFRRVKNVPAHPSNPANGTWQRYATSDGKGNSTSTDPNSRMLIVTPTHWMSMDLRNKKFDAASYGTYTISGDVVTTQLLYSTQPFRRNDQLRFNQRVENGTTLLLTAKEKSPHGEMTFVDIYKKADSR